MQMATHSRSLFPGVTGTLTAATLGWVAGTALQLQQPDLGSPVVYMAFMALALVGYAYTATKNI